MMFLEHFLELHDGIILLPFPHSPHVQTLDVFTQDSFGIASGWFSLIASGD